MDDTQTAASPLARTASLVAYFGVGSVLIGIGAVQIGIVPPMIAFGLFAVGTLLCGSLGLVLGAVTLFKARNDAGSADRGAAWRGMGISLVLLIAVMTGMSSGRGLPPINDITTDVNDPPAFAAALYPDRDMVYPAGFGVFVEEAYPDLAPIVTDRTPGEAYRRAIKSARVLGWEITHESPDQGSFDATETTAIFRFIDDITVRIRATESGSRVDLRSKSRDGRGDLGANAARIRRFVQENK
jgi:uncharacterized protein (DUF1499 family)